MEMLLKGGVSLEKPMTLIGSAQLQGEDSKLRPHNLVTVLNEDKHGAKASK